jgi:tetratricopeptide (TPR) repeat protein
LNLLSAAAGSFEEGRYAAARKKLIEAKALSSRAGAIRELLALSCYRMGNWQEALREIRTFRRITGDTTHMAVEMDSLRALERFDDVHATWETFQELGGSKAAEAELRVVYGSFLLDQGKDRDAWEVTRPQRLTEDSPEWEIRRWYVAARAAARLGDKGTAKQIATAIEKQDPAMPGLEALHNEIA